MSNCIEIINQNNSTTIKNTIALTGLTRQKRDKVTKLKLMPHNEPGIVFRVKNNNHCYEVPVVYTSVANSKGDRTTYLANKKGEIVRTVEHLLSALYATGICSLIIEVNGSNEIPVFDHSAKVFTEEIKRAGTVKINKEQFVLKVVNQILFRYKDSLAILRPSTLTVCSVLIQFNNPIGEQYFSIPLTKSVYYRKIAWARSFIRTDCDEQYWRECKRKIPLLPNDIKKCPIPVFNKGEWIIKPATKDEPARHKLLDLIGDLAVVGFPVVGSITVIRPSHDFNRRLVEHLGELIERRKNIF